MFLKSTSTLLGVFEGHVTTSMCVFGESEVLSAMRTDDTIKASELYLLVNKSYENVHNYK